MIIQNGNIEVKEKCPMGIDSETGHPMMSSSSWGCPIPCQYVPISHDNLAKSNGEHYTLQSYNVYVEEQPFCTCGEQVRLTDAFGNPIGEFSVVSVEWLEAVCQTKVVI